MVAKTTVPETRVVAKAPVAETPVVAKAPVADAPMVAKAPVDADPKPADAPKRRLGAPPTASAELEKSDPRHAAARKFARLAVSEIKLYQEAEVVAGRADHDLWSRLQADIDMCIATYERRVPEEVRLQFDHLYDELVRQLAEGDAAKMGKDAPTTTARPTR